MTRKFWFKSDEQSSLLPLAVQVEYCAENATITLECISLRRELQRTKEKRKSNRRVHEKVKKHYESMLSSEGFYIDRIMQGRKLLNKYVEAVKSLYQMMPAPYILRKHAELIQSVRNQELLETYIRLKEQHSDELIQYVQRKRMNLIKGLFIQEDRVDIIKEEIVHRVAQKVANLFYRQRANVAATPLNKQQDTLEYFNSSYHSTSQSSLIQNMPCADEYRTGTPWRNDATFAY
mmetsp:Transcript_1427/g.2119  ORF Transcript_1427/g.2119 Transcript_1427/m.2119 type:complete len:234 (-) Transcript_1427:332-1033(-)|eukprot:CAMPEP_0194221608 /NCGR_PEP_ID=MMETSP0156-20130528/30966_1 /TAXON_ID=33649 /ORGANISM="Thalassionema nitzschioides, Strain L26-B" /LENGTH=233 /DNA_ID=CAMNT_0038952069 /DNA_START=144 /DNA_END=845 /DNA_ORIENTATION=-